MRSLVASGCKHRTHVSGELVICYQDAVRQYTRAPASSGQWTELVTAAVRRSHPKLCFALPCWARRLLASRRLSKLSCSRRWWNRIFGARFGINDQTASTLTWVLIAGFPIAVTLAWLYEVSPGGLIRTSSEESVSNPFRPSQKKPFTGVWMISFLVLLLAAQYYYFNYVKGTGGFGGNEKSIAVLPFENRSDNKNDGYFADGLTDDIINRLYRIPGLHVISITSSQQYGNSKKSIQEIAKELNVATILTGSVQRVGDQTKIITQFHDGATDMHLWGETYQRKGTDLLNVQAEIAIQIANSLKIKLNEFDQDNLNRKPTENLTAFDYYTKGRSLFNYNNSDSTDMAIKQYKMAIALDTNYSLAWAGLGDAYAQMHARFARGINWVDSSIVAGQKAVTLDTNSSDAYKALAAAYNYARKYDTAFMLLKKAVVKNPLNARAIGNLGTAYFFRLEYGEALKLHKRSAQLNPRNSIPFQLVGWIYRLLGDLPEAESWLTTSLELDPNWWDTYRELAFVYCSQGRKKEALDLVPRMLQSGKRDSRTMEIAGRIGHFANDNELAKGYFFESISKNMSYNTDPNSLSAIGLGQILLAEGKRAEAEIYLSHALELNLNEVKRGSQDDDPPFNIAAIYAIQGNRTQSLQWLQKAIDMKWIDYAQVEYGPYFASFRSDPGFRDKLSAVHFKIDSMRESTINY